MFLEIVVSIFSTSPKKGAYLKTSTIVKFKYVDSFTYFCDCVSYRLIFVIDEHNSWVQGRKSV